MSCALSRSSLVIPVMLVISEETSLDGLTKEEKVSIISLPSTLTAPISIISSSLGFRPVVSRSKTTKEASSSERASS